MVYFDRIFIPSTFLLIFIFLFTAVPCYGYVCTNVKYNPDVFDLTPILHSSEDRVCEKTCSDDTYYCSGCQQYICKINATFYFGLGCTSDVINFCQPGTDSNQSYVIEVGELIVNGYDDWPSSFGLYQKYMEEVKPYGNDSMQERFFWLESLKAMNLIVTYHHMNFWIEKATGFIPINLQNFINEIRNSEIIVEKKIKEKSKMVLQIQTESLFNDLQDVQKAANQQSLPENQYFQQKFAEMEVKMEVVKKNDYIFNSYIIISNETLINVETEMNNFQSESLALIWSIRGSSLFKQCEKIHADILQKVSSVKEKVLDLLTFANETIENITFVADDEIFLFQSAGYEARKAMKDFESEKEMKDLMKEVKEAAEDIKKIGEAAQKTAENAQAIANESNMTAINAGKTADKAQQIADESKLTAEKVVKIAEDTKKAADSKAPKKLLAEALRSNGRKSDGFEVAMILSILVAFLI